MSRTGFDAVNDAIERAKPERYTPRRPTKVYELYPQGFGFFWVQTVDYHGTALMVAATSVRQAYAVAHKRVWINPEHEHPVGIVSKYHRDTGYTLWCGCSGHSVTGGDVGHGAGIRALRAAIDAHHCDDPRAERVCTPARRAKVMNVPPLDASHAPTPERAQDQHEGADQPPT